VIPAGIIIAFGYKYASMVNTETQSLCLFILWDLRFVSHPSKFFQRLSSLADKKDRFDVYAPE
jgi:hypothetical protein